MEVSKTTVNWDNSNIYKSFTDSQIEKDFSTLKLHRDFLELKSPLFLQIVNKLDQNQAGQGIQTELAEMLPLALECYKKEKECSVLLNALRVFSHCALSVNSQNQEAKNLSNRTSAFASELEKSSKSFQLFLLRSPENFLEDFLKNEFAGHDEFILRYRRQQNDYLLSIPEEVIIEGLSFDGFHSWGRLYSELAGTIKVDIDGKQMGMAEANNWLFTSDRNKRKKAYAGINKAWQQHEISASFVLNSIYGNRLEQAKFRSNKKPFHYLDQSCHESRITKETLNTLMDTAYQNREVGQKALTLMAKEMGEKQLGPWDTLAGYPHSTSAISFNEAIDIVIKAFSEFSPEMGAFVKMCVDKKWIDATASENRGAGAYCTRFTKVREARVFMTYDGSMKNVITLAHELGHAYHSWVMRELPLGQTMYPTTLTETASIFGETLVRQALLKRATTNQQKKEILWQEIESAGNLMINIPARYEFEKMAMELRKTKSISAKEFSNLTTQAWAKWYENTLSEYNDMFWASKMHFSFSHIGFYNYPYLFGYLFSLGIYAQKDKKVSGFVELYHSILKNTGRMTVEQLIQKHLDQDISKSDFWQASINIVADAVHEYERLS